MAYPGTYNFNYYKGDTYEFRVYPKDASGNVFDLSTFTNIAFTISTARGVAGVINRIEAYAVKSNDNSYITCTIRPTDGAQMASGNQYVYDVEINKSSSPYSIVYTLLTGTITLTEQVTGAA